MARKVFFDPVNSNPDFPRLEEDILDGWYSEGIVKKYLQKNNRSGKIFSFLDGPITANNPMGVHHAWGRTYKDLWQRYKNMKGFRQRFQNGFDCQGLWVEVEVEKELGLKNKRDIENLVKGDRKKSIEKFVQLCRDRVKKYSDIQTQQSKRLGYFMDWDHSYFTLSEDNNYMIWHFLKKCHERGLIYKGRDSVPWCPRCQTSISQHEILTEDYKEIVHDSIYFRLPIKKRAGEYLLVWTTTPWTIPANVVVAVDTDKNYVKVEAEDGKTYWILEELSSKIKGKVTDKKLGKYLVGWEYSAPFDSLDRVSEVLGKSKHVVVASDPLILPISVEEGTGLVHVAPGAGSEDFSLGKKLGLGVIEVIDEEANYLQGLGDLSGRNAKSNPQIIIDYLTIKDSGEYLLKVEKYKHRYPACWRCKTELVWRVVDEWYIAMDPLREDMKRVAKKINWIPSFGMARELDWLENMHDWLISKRNRYWGLALPIWECEKCGHFDVIGSKDELKERAIEGWKLFEGKSPHKPQIDEVKIKCAKCGNKVSRIEPVGNPWLDAGIVPFSTISEDNRSANFEKTSSRPLYLTDRERWKEWFPADFITESFPGQFKNWFYSLIAMSTVLENEEPFKTVLGYATLLAEDGRPMHKSWGNSIEFNEGAARIGVDVMRWMYLRQNPNENLLFGYKTADEVRRRFHLKLWNVYNFFVTYANLDGWKPTSVKKAKDSSGNPLDRWILVRLSQTINKVEDALDKYDSPTACTLLEIFLDDLSNWYIRRSRERVGFVARSEKDKDMFYTTCYRVLTVFSQVLAPFIPFISESIYRNLTKEASVHLKEWPDLSVFDDDLIKKMDYARRICEVAHSGRKEKGIAVRQPLLEVKTNVGDLGDEMADIICKEINVKKVRWGDEGYPEEVKAELDLTITDELKEEANARELIRKIQQERKNQGIMISMPVRVTSPWLPSSEKLVRLVKTVTQAVVLDYGDFSVEKVESNQKDKDL